MRAQGICLGLLLVIGLSSCQGTDTPQTQDRDPALGQMAPVTSVAVMQPTLPSLLDESLYPEVTIEAETPVPTVVPTAAPTAVPTSKIVQPSAPNAGAANAAPTLAPTVQVSSGGEQTVLITFYYCQRTVERADDGGGYCGNTATGVPVHPGSAACPRSWLGRTFTIPTDPNALIYKCEDVGGGVTGNHVDIWFMTNGEGWNSPITGRGRTIIWQD